MDFCVDAAATLATKAFEARVGIISFKLALELRLSCLNLRDTDTYTPVDGVCDANRKDAQLRRIGGFNINGKLVNNL